MTIHALAARLPGAATMMQDEPPDRLAVALERTRSLRLIARAAREKAQQLQYTALVLRHGACSAREEATAARSQRRRAAFACGEAG